AGELDVQGEATIGIGRRPDAPVVRLHDRAADRKTHAEAAGFAGYEPLEHPRQLRLLRADPAVADRDFHDPRGAEASSEYDFATSVRDVGDRLAGVDE